MPAVTLAGDTELDRQCYGTGTAPQTIEACTVVIAGGLVGRKDLGAAFKLRGSAYADVGEYDKAIDDYGHAIEINPGDAEVFNERGASFGGKGQYAQSILEYDRALALKPESPMALGQGGDGPARGSSGRLQRIAPPQAGQFQHIGLARLCLSQARPSERLLPTMTPRLKSIPEIPIPCSAGGLPSG